MSSSISTRSDREDVYARRRTRPPPFAALGAKIDRASVADGLLREDLAKKRHTSVLRAILSGHEVGQDFRRRARVPGRQEGSVERREYVGRGRGLRVGDNLLELALNELAEAVEVQIRVLRVQESASDSPETRCRRRAS